MEIHAIETGKVKVTENWRVGRGRCQALVKYLV
jgi:hypothetical protein